MKKYFLYLTSIFIIFFIAFIVFFNLLPEIIKKTSYSYINGTVDFSDLNIGLSSSVVRNLELKDNAGDKALSLSSVKLEYDIHTLLSGDVVGSIRKISIVNPKILVKRYKNGNINLLSILKKSKKESKKVNWRGDIEISDGILDIVAYGFGSKPLNIKFHDIAVVSVFDDYSQKSKITTSASESFPSNASWKAQGTYSISEPSVNVSGNISNIDVQNWIAVLFPSYGVKAYSPHCSASFKFRSTSDLLSTLFENLFAEIFISANVKKITLPVMSLNADNLRLKVGVTKTGVFLREASGSIFSSPFNFTGSLIDFKGKFLDFQGGIKNLNHDILLKNPFFQKLGVKDLVSGGASNCSLKLSGSFDDPMLRLNLNGNNIYMRDIGVWSYSLAAEIKKNFIRIVSADYSTDSFSLKGDGWFFPKSQKLLLSLSALGCPPLFNLPLSLSSADCNVTVCGTIKDPLVLGNVNGYGITAKINGSEKAFIGDAASAFLFSDSTVFFPDIALSGSSGIVSSKAFYDIQNSIFAASAQADDYNLKALGTSANISGHISAVGRPDLPFAAGNLKLGNIQSSGMRLGDMNFPLAAAKDFVVFSLNAISPAGSALAAGSVSLPDKGADMCFKTCDFDSTNVFKSGVDLPKVSGDISGKLIGDAESGYLLGADLLQRSASSEQASKQRTAGRIGGVFHAGSEPSIISYALLHNPEINLPATGCFSALKGSVKDGSLLLSGALKTLSAFGEISFDDAEFAGIPVSQANFYTSLNGGDLNVKSVSASGSAGSFYLAGKADLKNKDAYLALDAFNLNLNSLITETDLSPWNINIRNLLQNSKFYECQGTAYVEADVKIKNGGQPTVDGRCYVPDGVWRNERLALFSAFSSTAQFVAINHFDLSMGVSGFTGQGCVGLRQDSPLALNVEAKKGDIGRLVALSPFQDIPIKGKFDGSLILTGTLMNPELNGSIMVTDVLLAGLNVNSLSADIKTRKNCLSLDNISIDTPYALAKGLGTITSDGKINLSLASDDVLLGNIPELKRYLSGDAAAKFDLKVSGTHVKPVLSASFKTTNSFAINNYNLDSIEGSVIYDDGLVTVNNFAAKKDKELYSFAGKAKLNLPFKNVNSRRFILRRLVSDLVLAVNIENGNLELFSDLASNGEEDNIQLCSGHINGKLFFERSFPARQSKVNIDMSMSDGSFMGVRFDRFTLLADGENRNFKNFDVDLLSKSGTLKAVGYFNDTDDSGIYVKSTDLDLALIKPFVSYLPENFIPYGKCDIYGKLAGKLRNPDISCLIEVKDAKVGDVPLGKVTGKFSTEQLDVPVPFKGYITEQLDVIPEKPVVYINSNERSNVLTSDIRLISDTADLRLNGHLPFSFSNFDLAQNGDMDLNFSAETSTLDLLRIFAPISEISSGSLSSKANIYGVFPDILITGSAVVENGEITPLVLKSPLKIVNTSVDFKGRDILADINGKMGDGTFNLGGIIDFTNMRLKAADMFLKGENLQVICQTLFSGLMSCDVRFLMNESEKKLSGNIDVFDALLAASPSLFSKFSKGDKESEESDPSSENNNWFKNSSYLNITDKQTSAKIETVPETENDAFDLKPYIPDLFAGTVLDLNFNLGQKVWGTFMSSQVQATGNVHIAGMIEKPNLKGRIALSKGTVVIPLVLAPFKLNYGSLLFSGDGIIPKIFVNAESKYSEYTSYLTVAGSVISPKITIEGSVDGLTENNYNPSGGISSTSSFDAVSNMANSYMSSMALSSLVEFSFMRPTLNALNRSLGLSDMSVEFNERGYFTVRLARTISKDDSLLLIYEYSPDLQGQYRNLLGFEYRFSRGMKVRVSQDIRGGMYIWVQSFRKF